MNSSKQTGLVRIAFLLLCILPTATQTYHIFFRLPSSERKPESRRLTEESGSKVSNSQGGTKTDQNQGDRPVIQHPERKLDFGWLEGQGIDPALIEVSGGAKFLKNTLAENHPLRELPIEHGEIYEDPHRLVLRVKTANLTLKTLRQLVMRFQSGHFESALERATEKLILVKDLVLRQTASAESLAVRIRGVELKLSPNNRALNLSGRLVTIQTSSGGAVELPFSLELKRISAGVGRPTTSPTTLMMDGQIQAWPIWLLGSRWSPALGETAQLTGKYHVDDLANDFANDFGRVQFKGQIAAVNCESLSSWLNPANMALVRGNCEINCQDLVVEQNVVQTFRGAIKGSTPGSVGQGLANLLGENVHWLPESPLVEYRSFLLDLRYSRSPTGGISFFVGSRYGGGQLIWSADGTDILVQRSR